MTDDKEFLELAAKAAGFTHLTYCPAWKCMAEFVKQGDYYKWETYWNPLKDDSDALLLAALLGLNISHGIAPTGIKVVMVSCEERFGGWFEEVLGNDPLTAVRRAIVRAAAEIWKRTPVSPATSSQKPTSK